MKTFYVVSGFMRTGTSMMMKALEAGGLKTAYNKARDAMNTQQGDNDYQPNEGGFYELTRQEYLSPDFPMNIDGNLFKCLSGGMPRLPNGKYKIVFMMRDPEEIRQSFEAFFHGSKLPNIQNYHKMMERVLGIMDVRTDMDVTVFQYRDVLADPIKHFTQLKEAGWPIDAQKAATIVEPTKCRFRKELLIPGV